MRHKRGHEDEIARSRLGHELKPLAPAHARPPAHHVDHALELTMMMCAGPGIGPDADRSGPDLLRPHTGKIDCSPAAHAGSLRGIRIERMARDHLHAVMLPPRYGNFLRRASGLAGGAGLPLPRLACRGVPRARPTPRRHRDFLLGAFAAAAVGAGALTAASRGST